MWAGVEPWLGLLLARVQEIWLPSTWSLVWRRLYSNKTVHEAGSGKASTGTGGCLGCTNLITAVSIANILYGGVPRVVIMSLNRWQSCSRLREDCTVVGSWHLQLCFPRHERVSKGSTVRWLQIAGESEQTRRGDR